MVKQSQKDRGSEEKPLNPCHGLLFFQMTKTIIISQVSHRAMGAVCGFTKGSRCSWEASSEFECPVLLNEDGEGIVKSNSHQTLPENDKCR